MDGKEGDTFSLCTMTKGFILGMSLWLQANTSQFSLMKVLSAWKTVGLARVPILVIRLGLESSRSISSSLSMGSITIRCSYIFMAWRWSSIFIIAM